MLTQHGVNIKNMKYSCWNIKKASTFKITSSSGYWIILEWLLEWTNAQWDCKTAISSGVTSRRWLPRPSLFLYSFLSSTAFLLLTGPTSLIEHPTRHMSGEGFKYLSDRCSAVYFSTSWQQIQRNNLPLTGKETYRSYLQFSLVYISHFKVFKRHCAYERVL